jgi:hypothetical protein
MNGLGIAVLRVLDKDTTRKVAIVVPVLMWGLPDLE